MFGDALFSGTRFIRWTLCPVLVVSAIILFLTIDELSSLSSLLTFAAGWTGLLLGLALYDGSRFWWAARTVTAIVFLAALLYLLDEVLLSSKPLRLIESRAEPSPRNAILAFALFGLPALWYTLLGRFTLRPKVQAHESHEA